MMRQIRISVGEWEHKETIQKKNQLFIVVLDKSMFQYNYKL